MSNGTDGKLHAAGSRDQLLDLALLQGNRFIKELLRSKELPIGTNKQQFEQHLRDALTSNQINDADIDDWLAEVEGWGDQHVFLFAVPGTQRHAVKDRTVFSRSLKASKLYKFLDADIPFNPDDELTLATVQHSDDGISFLWVRGSPALIRRKNHDFEVEIAGDDIEFHAYERRWSRVAARFEWRFASNLAGVFLSRRSDERDYTQQRDLVLQTVDAVLPQRVNWRPVDIPRAITQLDSKGLDTPNDQGSRRRVRMSSTVFRGASANVRLAAMSETASYQDDADIRQVRKAVDTEILVGTSSDCHLTPEADGAATRELHIRLYGNEQRIMLWGKMSANEVWSVLADLRSYAK